MWKGDTAAKMAPKFHRIAAGGDPEAGFPPKEIFDQIKLGRVDSEISNVATSSDIYGEARIKFHWRVSEKELGESPRR